MKPNEIQRVNLKAGVLERGHQRRMPWDPHLLREGLASLVWASFFGGAILLGVLVACIIAFALLPVIAVMSALMLLSMIGTPRSTSCVRVRAKHLTGYRRSGWSSNAHQ
jgi:uncharacterized membrane protein YoaK (UPF0700 family)